MEDMEAMEDTCILINILLNGSTIHWKYKQLMWNKWSVCAGIQILADVEI